MAELWPPRGFLSLELERKPAGLGSPIITPVSSVQVTEELVHKCLLTSVLTAHLWEQSQAPLGFLGPICSLPLRKGVLCTSVLSAYLLHFSSPQI